MNTTGQVLIVDDSPDFVAIYRETFEAQGLLVTVAHTSEEAVAELESRGSDFDVVLLDQKLQGPGGPDSGLELVGLVQRHAPFAKAIVVTGYATPDAIERAFRLGVYDYLVKNGAFDALLRAKMRNAIEVTSERRIAARTRDAVLAELRAEWSRACTEKNRQRKGALLESVVKLLFRATPGFERVWTNLDNTVEEIDIVVENCSDDALWKSDGASYILGECKNWSSKCGSSEIGSFYLKLRGKNGRARAGFFFSVGGFTPEFHKALTTIKADDVLIIPVDSAALERWINADDRAEVVRELHRAAVFGTA